MRKAVVARQAEQVRRPTDQYSSAPKGWEQMDRTLPCADCRKGGRLRRLADKLTLCGVCLRDRRERREAV